MREVVTLSEKESFTAGLSTLPFSALKDSPA